MIAGLRSAAEPATLARGAARAASATATRVERRLHRSDAVLPISVAAIVLAGSLLSILPDAVPSGPVGGPNGIGAEPRLAVGGSAGDRVAGPARGGAEFRPVAPEAFRLRPAPNLAAPAADPIEGPFLEDGTLVKPVAVDTTVADGSGLLKTYQVRPGDSLVGIAKQFGVSMMTVWWANDIKSKDSLVVGHVLTIPPVDGLVVRVKAGDTLESIAAAHKVSADEIYRINELEDRTLVIGQTLVLPGAVGAPIPTPTPRPRAVVRSGTVSGPAKYSGGAFAWPVVGGGNYISQYFHSGHYGIDIAATYGSTVRAAAGGTVTFAGWKNNGGGYQVWISHGSGLYTTYSHMSGVSVGRGQGVGRGQQVGRIGQSGWATGPHLHFEVWKGGIWNGGRRVNPLAYL